MEKFAKWGGRGGDGGGGGGGDEEGKCGGDGEGCLEGCKTPGGCTVLDGAVISGERC